MADSRNIVIELKVQNSNATPASGNENAKNDGDLSETLQIALHPIKSFEKATFGKNVLGYQAFNYAKAQVKQVAQYTLGKYFSLTENYTAQQAYENAMTAISKTTSFGSAVISGALLGASMGGPAAPITAAIGASIAALGTGISEGINIYQRFKEQDRFLVNTNLQSNFQMVRLGLVDGGRGSEN